MIEKIQKSFEKNNYVIIKKFLPLSMANLFYYHVLLSEKVSKFIHESNDTNLNKNNEYGTFNDSQAPGDYSKYAEPIFESLMCQTLPDLKCYTGLDLIPTYTYHRLYTTGTELIRHKDRDSCEISTTICLGYDNTNLSEDKKNHNWPMYVGPADGSENDKGKPCYLDPGDMIIYKGCVIEHWREPLIGKNHAQLFVHYNKDNEDNKDRLYDSRPAPHLTGNFKIIPNN
jgi:hypothetical protein